MRRRGAANDVPRPSCPTRCCPTRRAYGYWPPMDEGAISDLTPDHWWLLVTTVEHAEELYERLQRQLIAQIVARRARWADLMNDMRRDLGAE